MCLNESTFECFCCSSVCATVRLLSDINPKGDHSVGIKVDSGAGGNDMLRCVFPQLHPAKLTLNGHPLGLEPTLTQFTADNWTDIPVYGWIRTPVLWKPGSANVSLCCLRTKWFVADTTGPAILRLPSCNEL